MIKLDNVTKTYGTGISALTDLNLAIEKGEFVFVVGPSGSGKTTLFRLLIREVVPTKGSIIINNWDIAKLPNSKVPHLRRKIGVVFQDLKLLMDRTILENILLPLEMSNVEHKEAKARAEQILQQVGILAHKEKFPVQLSGGELQRTAIARALVFSPDILLADEPTGNLDITTSWEIVKLLQDINKLGTTVLMATHNNDIVNSLLKRVVTLDKGILVKDEKREGKEEKKESKETPSDAKAVEGKEETHSAGSGQAKEKSKEEKDK